MISIFSHLLKKRSYPLWLAGQIWFSLSCIDVIAAPSEDRYQVNDVDHEIAYSLNPRKVDLLSSSNSNQPDPFAIWDTGIKGESPAAVIAAGIRPELVKTNNSYLLYLLKRPPPPV